MSFFEELKRRNVFRVGIAYVLLGWVVMQAADFALDLIDAPNWIIQVFFIAGIAGLPIVLFFAWAFEVTPEGIKRERDVDRSRSITPRTGRKLDRAIILFLALAVVFLLARPYGHEPAPVAESTATAVPERRLVESAPAAEERSVAVLPFLALSDGPDDGYFADGLTEEILNALAQLPELLVTARTSSFAFKGQDRPVQDIARELGVAHVVEGSVRRAGDRLRVSAQLVRAEDGFQLWADSYDSTSDDAITVQEEIATEIATALDVVMDEDRRAAMRRAGLRDPAAFVAYQKGLEAYREAHGSAGQVDKLLAANTHFDAVLERVPGYPPALLHHADPYVHVINDAASNEPTLDNVPADIRDNAYDLAVRDLELALDNARSLSEKSVIEFDLAVISGDFYRIRNRIEAYLGSTGCEHPSWVDPMATVYGYAPALVDRLESVVDCNPLGAVVRFSQIRAATWAGDAERALALAERAREKVDHEWVDLAAAMALIQAGRYESALNDMEANLDDGFFQALVRVKLAAARGDADAARRAYEEVRAVLPDGDTGRFFEIQYHATLGDRAEANRLAGLVDEQAYGPLPLTLITMWCHCGAPFDLAATPNFAAAIELGDLPWPPASPVTFPLKDW